MAAGRRQDGASADMNEHVVILAGGRGTRLWPLTRSVPKPMLPFMGQPVLVGWFRRLAQEGFTNVHLAIGPEVAPFRPAVAEGRRLGLDIRIHTERRPLGSGGALSALTDVVSGDVIVVNGDVVTGTVVRELLDAHVAMGALGTILTAEAVSAEGFGTMEVDAGQVSHFVEKGDTGRPGPYHVNAGLYVLSPQLVPRLQDHGFSSLERELFPGFAEAGWLRALPARSGWADLGTPPRYLQAHVDALEGRIAWPYPDDLVELEPGVRLGPDVVVGPRSQLIPPVTLCGGAVIDSDSQIGPHVVMGRCASVGSRSSMRHAVLHDHAKVGHSQRICGQIVGRDSSLALGRDAPQELEARVEIQSPL